MPFEWLQRRIEIKKAEVDEITKPDTVSMGTAMHPDDETAERNRCPATETPFTTVDFDGTILLRRAAIALFRENLSESVDISPALKVVAQSLRTRLENMHDCSLHQLLLPGDRVFARKRDTGGGAGRGAGAADSASGQTRPFVVEIESVRVSDDLFANWTAREVAARA